MRLQEGDEIRWASRASATTQPIITKREKNKRGIYGNVRFEKTKNWGLELLIHTYIIASSSKRRLWFAASGTELLSTRGRKKMVISMHLYLVCFLFLLVKKFDSLKKEFQNSSIIAVLCL